MSHKDLHEFKLGELCAKIGSGVTPRGGVNVYKQEGISLIRSQNVYDYELEPNGLVFIDEKQAEKMKNVEVLTNDVLLNITGDSVARCCIVPEKLLPARVNQHVSIIRANSQQLNPKYLLYWINNFSTKELLLSLASTGGTRKALTKSMIENLKMVIPLDTEQQAIAATLSCLDDKIELNNQINKALEEIAQAIFKIWFVGFEPFQDDEFEDSELGMIPKGWRVEKLDNIADYLNGLAMQKHRPEKEEYLPVIKIKELNQGFTDVNSDKASISIPKQYFIQDGDVIFSWSGTLMVKIWSGGLGGLNQHLFKVTSNKYDKWFYYMWTLKHLEKFRAIAKDKATTMGHIKRSHLSESKVLIPKDSDMRTLNGVMNPIIEQMIGISVQNGNLKAIRDALLPKLMSGEIRVPIEEVQ